MPPLFGCAFYPQVDGLPAREKPVSQENGATMIGWKRLVTSSTAILAVAVFVTSSTISGSTISGTSVPQKPAGPRPPVIASSWKIAALGDSVTAGTNCDCIAFPMLYAQELSTSRGVTGTPVNLGVGGGTSGDLLGQLRNSRSEEFVAVKNADIDLLTIGANDFADNYDEITQGDCAGPDATDCVRDQIAEMRHNIAAALKQIHELRHGKPTAVLVTGYWNVFEDGDVATEAFPSAGLKATRMLTAEVNRAIEAAAKAAGATYVDLLTPFNGAAAHGDVTSLLAPDGDHPNAKGQALIANRLLAAGLPGLTTG